MTSTFKPETLAAFMQSVVDEPDLPTLFLRTVIQAVTTHKGLQQYVSSTLLTRLVLRKIWTTPSLWEGFIRLSKAIAPHSFGALVMLPKDQLREVVTKQPALKQPLRDFVANSAWSSSCPLCEPSSQA
jgi:symplekin